MSRYADLWPVVPYWVEAITTDLDGLVTGWKFEPVPQDTPWWWAVYHGKYKRLGNRGPTPDWRDSLERRPRPANPTLCPHCGKEI